MSINRYWSELGETKEVYTIISQWRERETVCAEDGMVVGGVREWW